MALDHVKRNVHSVQKVLQACKIKDQLHLIESIICGTVTKLERPSGRITKNPTIQA